jgi:indole-3-glycerol phosphate synthase
MNILETICARKRLEVARQKEIIPLSQLENYLDFQNQEKRSFKQSLTDSSWGIIPEFKRRSPSKGWIHRDADVEKTVRGYCESGASAVSVLTDEPFFGGDFSDFKKARNILKIPLLRKDFIVDEYQIFQSARMGADVILLIAACLTPEEALRFSTTAHELGMETLLEIHREKELEYIQPMIDAVGINNRNLKTFVTDIRHTIRLAHRIPEEYVKISESGISDIQTVIHLRNEGFKGFLMGENFMKTENPAQTFRAFMADLESPPSCKIKIKVCGMKYPENLIELSRLPIQFMGLIFYEKSPRYMGNIEAATFNKIPKKIQKVGVFVNETQSNILGKIKEYDLQLVQLHGEESPLFCKELKEKGIKVIKAFPVEDRSDLEKCVLYEGACDYFLFDAKTPARGGSGKKFDRAILSGYTGRTPFFLSGGIAPEDAEAIRQLNIPQLYALDLNSRFEIEPGLKNKEQLNQFIAGLHS